jgi:hypothetical protein
MIISIHQPNFFPWFGYFLKIYRSEKFIFLDDVQIIKTGSSFTNRVKLNMQGKEQWYTVPIKRISNFQNINDTNFADSLWRKKFIATIKSNYSKAGFYHENIELIISLIEYETENISEFNINTISKLAEYFDIKTHLLKSSSFSVDSKSTKRIIDLIKECGGDAYLSGTGADKYQDLDMYKLSNIHLIYNDFNHPVYPQIKYSDFISNLSILDILFNLGKSNTIEIFQQYKF